MVARAFIISAWAGIAYSGIHRSANAYFTFRNVYWFLWPDGFLLGAGVAKGHVFSLHTFLVLRAHWLFGSAYHLPLARIGLYFGGRI